MKKAAIIGVYGVGDDFANGQAMKCYSITNWLIKKYGADQIQIINTYHWKNHPFRLCLELVRTLKKCKNIIIMPAHNGVQVLPRILYFLNKMHHRKLHYIVIGGWLADLLSKNVSLIKYIATFDSVHVETLSLQKSLQNLGLANTYYMPNSKDFDEADFNPKINNNKILRVCTYSRVVKEKGIEDAIEICRKANQILKTNIFHLDIYGKIGDEYKKEFFQLLNENKDTVSYCGIKGPNEAISILSKYFALLFPTYYQGECFAGTVLDAFASRTPIIANDWKYNSEIIQTKKNGFIYPFRNISMAATQLIALYEDTDLYAKIQQACLESAKCFSIDTVTKTFIELLD